jgi:TM2 domain-containing membrane protein YozV
MTDDQIEHRLLELAYTTSVTLTAPSVAYFAPCRIDDAQRVLDHLVATDRIQMHVNPDDGTITYTIAGRQEIAAPRPVAIALRHSHEASPALAAALSLVIPGAGQLYAGRPGAAVVWFISVMVGYFLIIPGLVLHALCIVSAAASAHRLNDAVERHLLNQPAR